MRLTYWKIIFYGRVVNKNGGISWAFKFKSASFVSPQTFWFSTQLEAISVFLRHPTDRANPPNVWAVELMGGGGQGQRLLDVFLTFFGWLSNQSTVKATPLQGCSLLSHCQWCNSSLPMIHWHYLDRVFFCGPTPTLCCSYCTVAKGLKLLKKGTSL